MVKTFLDFIATLIVGGIILLGILYCTVHPDKEVDYKKDKEDAKEPNNIMGIY